MKRPDPRSAQRAQRNVPPAALSGAVDLSGLKNRAQQPTPQAPANAAGGAASQPADSSSGRSQWVVDVTEATFQAEVVERSLQVPVLVDLWAEWCGPCKQLSPLLEKMAEQAGGAWILAKVDIDANQRIAQLFQVKSVPTVVAIAGGQPVEAFQGAQPEPQIRQWISALLDALRDQLPGIRAAEEQAGQVEQPEDPRFTLAEQALDQGDFASAEQMYQQILDQEPGNEQARLALRQVQFVARAEQADPAAPERAAAEPDNVDVQIAAAEAELASQQVEASFERLVATVRRTSGDERNRVREHLIELFGLFDDTDPRVLAARRALASALF